MSASIHNVKRAFTLKSPWLAGAVLNGEKPFENRSIAWAPGWYAVHVGVSKSGDEWAKQHVRECCSDDEGYATIAADIAAGFVPRGAIVGLCKVAHCLPPEACGGSPWALGPMCMVIDQTLWLASPIEGVRGQLGTWSVDGVVECRLGHTVGNSAIRVSRHVQNFPPNSVALVRARERARDAKRKRNREDGANGGQTKLTFAKTNTR